MYFKQVLGVQRQTTNVGEYLELGHVPNQFTAITAIMFSTKSWERIKHFRENNYVCQSYQDWENNNTSAITNIKYTGESVCDRFLQHEEKRYIDNLIQKKIQ